MNTTTASIMSAVPSFLRAIAAAPAASSFLTPAVDGLLLAGAALVERGDEAVQELQALTDQIKAMTQAGRDPTADEWTALHLRSDAAHAAIQAGAVETPNPTPPPATTPPAAP